MLHLGALRLCAGGLDRDDFEQIARLAALEAWLTFDANRGVTPKAWIKKLVRWRLREFLSVVLAISEAELRIEDAPVELYLSQHARLKSRGRKASTLLREMLGGW